MQPTPDSPAEMAWLSRFVESVRVLRPGGAPDQRLDRLPDGRTLLVFRALEGSDRGTATAVGPRTRALFKSAAGVARALIIQFKPGWSSLLLGVPAPELTDQFVKLDGIWGRAGDQLLEAVFDADGERQALQRIAQTLFERCTGTFESSSARLARRAVRILEAGEVRVEAVAGRLGVSPRHLRRAFTDNVGVGPKEFARGVRLRRAVQEAGSSPDWGRVATTAGYYDQAHLIGDFRDLVGLTPGAFLKLSSDLTPSSR